MSILQAGINCMGIYPVAGSGLLIDACDYYRAFYRTALGARRYILLAGWQFDSEVCLLRGEEAQGAPAEVRFLAFLQDLCRATPELEIYILAWDFSVIFSMEREWFQNIIFNWSGVDRIHFRFDGRHAVGATHHQKLVIVDGEIAFVGGIDICSERWDDRRHLQDNPQRLNIDGTPYGSYHDIQSCHTGEVVQELVTLFRQRWEDSGGDPLFLPEAGGGIPPLPEGTLPVAACRVALSRTRARNFQPPQDAVREIRQLFVDAITSAQELIYLENQYFSSQAVYWSLVSRMAEPNRPKLQIILILPDRLPFTEELFLGLPQSKMLASLQQVAQKSGHIFRAYSSACLKDTERRMTFIHSKLLLVDDTFLTVGSANATNRSMGLDTELNVSWEAADRGQGLAESIRRVRVSLLAEHVGLFGRGEEYRFEEIAGLVHRLDHLVDDPETRLCRYTPDPALERSEWPETMEPVGRVVDPEKPLMEDLIFEAISSTESGAFARGIMLLRQWLAQV